MAHFEIANGQAIKQPTELLQVTAEVVSPLELQVKFVQSETEFLALRDPWNALADNTAPCVFLRHEWFTAAWAWIKNEAELYLFCVYRQHQLIGLCPLVRRPVYSWGVKFWRLEFLAVPDTQRCDILGSPSDEADIISSVAGAIKQTQGAWDFCSLQNLTHEAAALKLPAALKAHDLTATVHEAAGNPFVTMDESWQHYYGRRSRGLKKNNNLDANRLKKIGEPEIIRVNETVDPATLESWLKIAINISAKSWKEKTGLSLNHGGPQRFIRALSEAANKYNWLSLWILKLNGEPIAMEYQLRYAGHVHALRADFNKDFMAYSPGAYLNWQILQGLFQSKGQTYYMGPGNNAYKLRWTRKAIPLQDLNIYSNNLRGRLLYAIEAFGRPLWRRIKKVATGKRPIS